MLPEQIEEGTKYQQKLNAQYHRLVDIYKRQRHDPLREPRAWKRLKQGQRICKRLMKGNLWPIKGDRLMRRLFSSPDYKRVMDVRPDGYCNPLIFESQEKVDEVGKTLQEILSNNPDLDIPDAFTRFDWFEVTDPVDKAGIMFFVDEDESSDTWKERAEEMKNSVSDKFIETILEMNDLKETD